MSRTPTASKIAAVGALTEGMSLRAVSRLTGLSRTRLGLLVLQMGLASERLLDEKIRGFRCEQIECDEMWTFIQKRRSRVRAGDSPEVGDAWIWSGIDPDSKLIPLHELELRIDEIEEALDDRGLERDAPFAVLCHHGHRSLRAALLLQQLGFTGARSVFGGIDLWASDVDPSIPRYVREGSKCTIV